MIRTKDLFPLINEIIRNQTSIKGLRISKTVKCFYVGIFRVFFETISINPKDSLKEARIAFHSLIKISAAKTLLEDFSKLSVKRKYYRYEDIGRRLILEASIRKYYGFNKDVCLYFADILESAYRRMTINLDTYLLVHERKTINIMDIGIAIFYMRQDPYNLLVNLSGYIRWECRDIYRIIRGKDIPLSLQIEYSSGKWQKASGDHFMSSLRRIGYRDLISPSGLYLLGDICSCWIIYLLKTEEPIYYYEFKGFNYKYKVFLDIFNERFDDYRILSDGFKEKSRIEIMRQLLGLLTEVLDSAFRKDMVLTEANIQGLFKKLGFFSFFINYM